MNILFIGSIYSEHLVPVYQKNCKSGYQFAAQALQSSLIQGLIENNTNLSVITMPCVPTFPFSYKKPFLKPDDFIFNNNKIGYTIGRINMPIIKQEIGWKKRIKQWFLETKGPKYILIYSLCAKFLKIAQYIKKEYPNVSITIVIADLPEYMAWNKYYTMLGLKKRDENIIKKNFQYIDKFVLLSKHMIEKLPLGKRPWIVMEGIFNPNNDSIEITSQKEKTKAILYTGNINKRYGIMDAVYAFTSLPNNDISFWICGFGDSENEIKEIANRDNRIVYWGSIPRHEALKLQQKASLLINPRHSNEEFTKYSFPSKTMEYLASGTPTLMCKLACIPDEYADYLFYIEDESIEGYRNAIMNIFNKDKLYLESFGKRAKQFILNNKTPYQQVKKIIDLMKG